MVVHACMRMYCASTDHAGDFITVKRGSRIATFLRSDAELLQQ
jgi:hypothetical protein